jgi:hypothetical protein
MLHDIIRDIFAMSGACPLHPRMRTNAGAVGLSAKYQKATSHVGLK